MPVLVPAKAGDDAIGRARVLDLDHRALAGLVVAVRRLRDHAVEAGAFEARRASRARRARSRVIGVRWIGGSRLREQLFERGAPLALRRAP